MLVEHREPVTQQMLSRRRHAQPFAQRREIRRGLLDQLACRHDPRGQRRDAGRFELGDRLHHIRMHGPARGVERYTHVLHDLVQRVVLCVRCRFHALQRSEAREPALRAFAEHDRCSRADERMRGQRRIDLGQLDPVAADFHLIVLPPEEFERTVGAHAAKIAGAIQPAPVAMTDEAFGRAHGIVRVTRRGTPPTWISPRTPGGHGRPSASSTSIVCPVSARPYGMLASCVSAARIGCSIDQIDASVAPPRLNNALSGQRRHQRAGSVTGIQSPDHSTRRAARRAPARLRDSRSASALARAPSSTRHAVAHHQLGPVRRIVAARRIGQHDARAARGRAEEVVDGQVEAEFGRPSTTSPSPTSWRALMSASVLHTAAWLSITPFGSPVGRRIDHVGERVAVDFMHSAAAIADRSATCRYRCACNHHVRSRAPAR